MRIVPRDDVTFVLAFYASGVDIRRARRFVERHGETVVDWAPALALTLFTQFAIWIEPTTGVVPGPRPVASVLYLAMTLSLGYRRSMPLVALALTLAASGWEVFRLPESEQGTFETFLALCLAAYATGAYSGSRSALVAGLVLPASVPLGDTLHRTIALDEGLAVSQVLPFWIWSAVFWAIGRGVRNRHVMVGILGERADRLEREREEKARTAVAEERARIARELHDVVAHGVSVMVVQAGAARRVLSADPQQAERSLLAVEATGRQSLAEMRRLLGVLRTEAGGLSLAPQPGLARVNDLVEQIRGAGLPVEVLNKGEARPLPAGVDMVAYRVIQEALTNVLKHAGAARATVTIGYLPDRIDLEVRDDGQGKAAQTDGRGHGLFGMRERVGLYGGRLNAGTLEAGGFVVNASIPTVDAQ
jgi:signal transduction histidine kinase